MACGQVHRSLTGTIHLLDKRQRDSFQEDYVAGRGNSIGANSTRNPDLTPLPCRLPEHVGSANSCQKPGKWLFLGWVGGRFLVQHYLHIPIATLFQRARITWHNCTRSGCHPVQSEIEKTLPWVPITQDWEIFLQGKRSAEVPCFGRRLLRVFRMKRDSIFRWCVNGRKPRG